MVQSGLVKDGTVVICGKRYIPREPFEVYSYRKEWEGATLIFDVYTSVEYSHYIRGYEVYLSDYIQCIGSYVHVPMLEDADGVVCQWWWTQDALDSQEKCPE